MKSLIVAIIIAFSIILTGVYSTKKLEDMSEYLIEMCDKTNKEIENDNFEKAEEYILEIEDFVEENYTMFASTIDHNEIDKIDMNIDQMKTYVAQGIKADSLSYGNILLGLIEHLPKDHRLKIENVL